MNASRITFLFTTALLALVLAAPAFGQEAYIQKADNFLILFDTSGTMAKEHQDSGKPRVEVAKELLHTINNDIPPFPYNAALYNISPWDPIYGYTAYEKKPFARAINSLPSQVEGGAFSHPTPLGQSMAKVARMLDEMQGRTVVYIFTDGVNTDNRDPVELAHRMADEFDVCFLVVSLAESRQGRETVEGIADANECSQLVDFDYAVRNPEVCTGQLCAVAPVVGESVTMIREGREYTPVHVAYFGLNKSELKPYAMEDLDEAAGVLKSKPGTRFYVAGFTDVTGSEGYNVELSRARAMAVRDYLVEKHGIASNRITVKWYGENAPLATNDTAAGRRLNRRAEYIVFGK
ncbi:OmpA family protein [Desulfohalovibrio reitneri]|uniref:OmpA family protein n=1 Tax=Desulfohalovibrio reitneri TaxID=1307759 RepID=UPI0004A6DC8B|nr:OmpA family protein [Desulfohalovibrio reitneri]